jgi:hypothetical protein
MPTYTTKPTTYAIDISNCGGVFNVDIHARGLDLDTALKVFDEAKHAFRQVRVTNDETGELMADYYYSDEWFEAVLPIEFAIRNIRKILEKEQAL